MTGRNLGERLVAIETTLNGTGDGENGLTARFEKLSREVQGLGRLVIYMTVAGMIVGYMLATFTPVILKLFNAS